MESTRQTLYTRFHCNEMVTVAKIVFKDFMKLAQVGGILTNYPRQSQIM